MHLELGVGGGGKECKEDHRKVGESRAGMGLQDLYDYVLSRGVVTREKKQGSESEVTH